MKYLKGRERFLSDIKQLNQQQINEAFDMGGSQGPFGNDIAWGDSLVGRLINWAIRKIGVAVNMVRIQPVIARLKMEFRYLLETTQVGKLDDETRKKISMFFIVQQIRIIKFAIVDMKSPGADEDAEIGEPQDITKMPFSDIKKENYLKECESIVDGCIEAIAGTADEYGEIDNYAELMKILKELQGMIKIMKTEIKETEGEGDDNKEDSETDSVDNYINNFSAVCGMVLEYDEMKKKQAAEFKSKAGATASTPTSGQKTGLQTEKEPEKELVGSATMDSYSYISEATVNSPVMKPLKSLYDTMKQLSPEDLVKDLTSFMKMSPEAKKDVKFSKPISNIYKYIRIKTGVKESVVNEDFNAIISRDRLLGDAILALYNVSKTKPDASFDGLTGNMKDNMSSFNTTMPNCLKPEAKKETEQKTESKLLRYQDFKDDYMINESKIGEFLGWGAAKIAQLFGYGEDEAKEVKDEEVKKMKVSKDKAQRILSLYWNEIYTTKITKLLLNEDEFKRLTEELSKVETVGTEGGLVINGMDPIIAILRCFNRAYKLYTVPVIPGGRSKGAVDRATFAEYTSFGSGTSGGEISAYAGPFRHNKTYNMWENAVMDILEDREYQPLFDKDTELRVGNKIKKGAGPILRKFMTDIMDGETLYKSGESRSGAAGAQKDMLEKYFGEVPEKISENDLSPGGKAEIESNAKLQSEISTATVEFNPGNAADINSKDDLKGMIIKLEVEMAKPADYKEEEKDKNKEIDTNKRYFFIQEDLDDMLYLVYSRKFGHLSKYIENDYSERENKFQVSFNPSALKSEAKAGLYLTKIKFNDFKKMLTQNGKVKLTGQVEGTTDIKSIGEQTTKKIEFLYTKENDEKPKIYKLEKLDFSETKGFKDVKTRSPQTF